MEERPIFVEADASKGRLDVHWAMNGQARNYLDSGAKLDGHIYFEGITIIAGHVDGEITMNGNLLITEEAEVNAEIKAVSIVIAGNVKGNITASERIEIRPTAKLRGNLTSPALIVHDGAVLEGHCSVYPVPSRKEAETPAPQTEESAGAAISFFITEKQKADLRARGYDDAVISKMKPADAHKILGII